MSYDASDLTRQMGVFMSTPSGERVARFGNREGGRRRMTRVTCTRSPGTEITTAPQNFGESFQGKGGRADASGFIYALRLEVDVG